MFSYIWPIALVVLSNVVYQICSKSVPDRVNPFAVLTVTYTIAALCSSVLFLFTRNGSGLFREISKMNWAPFVLGIVILGLEAEIGRAHV